MTAMCVTSNTTNVQTARDIHSEIIRVRKNLHCCSVVIGKSQPDKSPFPTVIIVNVRVGIFQSPLNTNDGFFFSHTCVI